MKRILSLSLALLMLLLSLCSCNKEEGEGVYDRRTMAFFQLMEEGTFWYDAEVKTATGSTYRLAQATDGVNTTTINNDGYEIFHNAADVKCVHEMNVNAKRYDTVITDKGTKFVFSGYNYVMFAEPDYMGDEELDGKTYYVEAFKAPASENSTTTVYDKYFFEGNTLVAVSTPAMTIYFKEYSKEVPSYVYLTPPSDFKAGTIREEHDVDYSDLV